MELFLKRYCLCLGLTFVAIKCCIASERMRSIQKIWDWGEFQMKKWKSHQAEENSVHSLSLDEIYILHNSIYSSFF